LALIRSLGYDPGPLPVVSRPFRRGYTSPHSPLHFVCLLHRIQLLRSGFPLSILPSRTYSVLLKADINYVTILGPKYWHAAISYRIKFHNPSKDRVDEIHYMGFQEIGKLASEYRHSLENLWEGQIGTILKSCSAIIFFQFFLNPES